MNVSRVMNVRSVRLFTYEAVVSAPVPVVALDQDVSVIVAVTQRLDRQSEVLPLRVQVPLDHFCAVDDPVLTGLKHLPQLQEWIRADNICMFVKTSLLEKRQSQGLHAHCTRPKRETPQIQTLQIGNFGKSEQTFKKIGK